MAGRLVVVATSPRLPAGALTWPAWEALRAGPVETSDAGSAQLPHLRAAGVDVRVVPPLAADAQARALHDRALTGATVTWLAAADGDAALVRAAGMLVARGSGVALEVVWGSSDPPGARLLDVVAVMDRLRSPGGCPWDAQQTHDSLRKYLLEEAYETVEAIEDDDRRALREELGDVLLQVVFHARIAEEHAEPWSVDDVAADLVDKLVRRHPHVFAGASADDLEGSWDALKAAEKGRTSVTEGVPLGQPALALAAKLQSRAAKLGAPLDAGVPSELWDAVRRCREQGLDPEAELRTVARAYRDRLAAVERGVRDEGRDPAGLTAEEWAQRWT